jgi:fluoride ion exporter CrcB/FEX
MSHAHTDSPLSKGVFGRIVLARRFNRPGHLPWGTFAANLIGTAIVGSLLIAKSRAHLDNIRDTPRWGTINWRSSFLSRPHIIMY